MLQEKAALHAERKTHGVDLDGVRFSRMVDAERAATVERARRATNAETETCVESPEMPVVRDTAEVHDHVSFTNKRVAVLVRVRPLSAAERAARAVDVVTCVPSTRGSPALAAVHEPRTKVDGTRHVESSRFDLDGAFDARASDADVYAAAIEPLVRLCLEGAATPADASSAARSSAKARGDDAAGANATVFAYGQTGSGKTHTMTSCYEDVARDVCLGARDRNLRVEVSFYEVCAGKCFDLLAERKRVKALEDARGRVRVVGLTERVVREPHEVLALAEEGAACRKTSRTDANASSSRSHAVFQIALRSDAVHAETRGSDAETVAARLSLVDLAGSERGADRGKAVSERIRREGAEINTSLLALKECIRALSAEKSVVAEPPPGDASARVPFRGSKLTTVLRDAFVGKRSRTVLLAHISPGHDSAEHTVNTLRYATRLKDVLKGEPRLGATERATGTEKRATGKERPDPSAAAPLRERDENAAFDDTRQTTLGSTSDERPSSASSDPDSPGNRGRPKERSEETRGVFSSGSGSRLALAEKRRVAFESGVALLEAHRTLARASEAEAGALESAERALAAVDRDAVDLKGEGDDESALDDFRAACDALAATLDGREALERRARQAAARAQTARAEEQAAADAAGALRGGG